MNSPNEKMFSSLKNADFNELSFFSVQEFSILPRKAHENGKIMLFQKQTLVSSLEAILADHVLVKGVARSCPGCPEGQSGWMLTC